MMWTWLYLSLIFAAAYVVYRYLTAPRPDRSRRGLNVVITGSSKGPLSLLNTTNICHRYYNDYLFEIFDEQRVG